MSVSPRDRNYFDKKKFPFVHSGHNYALDVAEGKIPNCVYIIGACERYLKDLEKKEYPFIPEWGEKYLRLVQKFEHVKGDWKPKNIQFSPWQNFVFMNIFGFKNEATGYRRFRVAHLEVPRGQGKSLLASQACLYMLALDNPNGNEISTFATKNEQARIVLDSARAMAQKNIDFLRATRTKVLAHKIVHEASNSFIRAMSSDSKSLDGLNDILAVIDELHSVTRELFDVVYSGMSKRRDSLLLCITTAGFDVDSVGYSQSIYARKVATGFLEDDQLFSAVYTIDEGDDIFSEDTWKKANPGYGVSVDPITFAAKAEKAKVTPSDLPNFKVKHLNMWISEMNAYFDTSKWDACADTSLKLEDFRGEKCRIGVDIANTVDLTSLGYVFKKDGLYYIFDKSFIPEETVKKVRSSMYENCIGKGQLNQTVGEAIDQSIIQKQILADHKFFRVQDTLFDPWSATKLMQDLAKERVQCTEFRMTTANLSEPTKMLNTLILQGKIRHNGSPLLRWCIGNVVAKEDAAGNIYPRKSHEKLKIDPIIAILMALASLIQDENKESVYAERGLRIL